MLTFRLMQFTDAYFGVPAAEIYGRDLEILRAGLRRQEDLMFQVMQNNLWGHNPGELERWADDGGRNA